MNTTLDGLVIMLTGITSVLVFLSVLVFSIVVISKAVKKLNQIFPEVSDIQTNSDKGIIAAIIAILKRK